ncbi:MAG TPA: class I poly(R)-hydroxyalkanoic acid synthase, partial [Caldimonas sp.]|nr:class I poly(R)-hydroxyalkanoic acid synthase [Caldimonas sp.]
MKNENQNSVASSMPDPLAMAGSAGELVADLGRSMQSVAGLSVPPRSLLKLQADYLAESTALWNRLIGAPCEAAETGKGDKRFAGQAWLENPATAYMAQMYLLNARTLLQLADEVQGDAKTKARVRFAVQQWIDAASPSNYLALNPEAQKKALETGGESIALGVRHLLDDIRQGHMSQTDETL